MLLSSAPEDFWKFVAVRGPEDCWIWTRGLQSMGYGHAYLDKKPVLAHRLAWSIFNGVPIPPGLEVLHSCDNPPCCNPGHLRVGTHAENMKEMKERGRQRILRGEKNIHHKISDVERAELIRLGREGTLSQKALATRFGLDSSTVSRLISGKRRPNGKL